jgi:DNA-binding transcriptional regulator YhcF (GntR family)
MYFNVKMQELQINHTSSQPKYLQLADAITLHIKEGNMDINEKLPSVNKLSRTLKISRETVFKALNYLSEKGIVESSNRMGYFVKKTDVIGELRVFMMLDKLTYFKEQIYQSIFHKISEFGEVDLYFHHHNFQLFETLITTNLNNYTHFVIVTFLREDVSPVLNKIPPNKRIMLDCYEPSLEGNYTMIYQDFARDIYEHLLEAQSQLNKYHQLVLVATPELYHAPQVIKGFNKFCKKHRLAGKIVPYVNPDEFEKGSVYITLRMNDRDLVDVIKLTHQHSLKLGEDIGLISYNDTPVKEVLEGGITVISSDFEFMGNTAADYIISGEIHSVANPSKLILRKSL